MVGQRKLQDATNGDTRAHCRREALGGSAVVGPLYLGDQVHDAQLLVHVQYPVGSCLVRLPVVSSQVVLPSEHSGAPWAEQPLFAAVFLCVQVPLQICSGAESSPASYMRTAIGFPVVATMMSVVEHSVSKRPTVPKKTMKLTRVASACCRRDRMLSTCRGQLGWSASGCWRLPGCCCTTELSEWKLGLKSVPCRATSVASKHLCWLGQGAASSPRSCQEEKRPWL